MSHSKCSFRYSFAQNHLPWHQDIINLLQTPAIWSLVPETVMNKSTTWKEVEFKYEQIIYATQEKQAILICNLYRRKRVKKASSLRSPAGTNNSICKLHFAWWREIVSCLWNPRAAKLICNSILAFAGDKPSISYIGLTPNMFIFICKSNALWQVGMKTITVHIWRL